MFCHYHIRSGTINAPHIVHKTFPMLPNYHCQVSALPKPTTTLLLLCWESLHSPTAGSCIDNECFGRYPSPKFCPSLC